VQTYPLCAITQLTSIAHRVRNRSSETFAAACALQSTYRWCMTGTPIHNRLDDYGALLSFQRLPHLDSRTEFYSWIEKPFFLKQPQSLERLQTLIQATCLRRTKNLIWHDLQLPPKEERVINIELNQEDKALYEFFKKRAPMFMGGQFSDKKAEITSRAHRGNILALINILRRLCDGGMQMLPREAFQAWRNRDTVPLFHTIGSTDKQCDHCSLQLSIGITSTDSICDSHSFCDSCLMTLSVCSLCDQDESSYDCRQKTTSPQEICTAIASSCTPSKVQALLANSKAEQQQNCVPLVNKPIKR
jgi:SNF2 family DNA or RNA helicase